MKNWNLALALGTAVVTIGHCVVFTSKAEAGSFSTSIDCPNPNVGLFTDEWLTGFLSGSGGTIDVINDDKFTFDVTCNSPGKVTLSDTGILESDESYHIKFKGVSGTGAFRLHFLAYLTNNGTEIPNTRRDWSSGLIGSLPGGATTIDYPWFGNLVDRGNSIIFNDLHFEVRITSTQPATFTWESVSLGVDANKIIPEPTSTLGILALGTLGAASTLKRQLKSSKSSEKETTKVS
jgi:hypothetical protein